MLIFGTIGGFVRSIALPSGITAALRGAVGAVFLLLVCRAGGRAVSVRRMLRGGPLLLASGVVLAADWVFLFEALKRTSIATATLSYYFAPVVVVVLSAFLFKEKLTPVKLCCIAAAMVGMVLVSGVAGPAGGGASLAGVGFGLAAAVCYGVLTVLNKLLTGVSLCEKIEKGTCRFLQHVPF